MNYTVIHIGTLREVDLAGMTPQEWAKRELDRVGRGDKPFYVGPEPDYVMTLNKRRPFNPDEGFGQYIEEKFIEYEGRLFEILQDRTREGGYISQLRSNPDGTYDYTMEFYNGETTLAEMLCDGFGNMSEMPTQK